MSAFKGKADMTVCGCLLSRSLLGVKRTSPFAPHMSAYDPKRTLVAPIPTTVLSPYDAVWGANETARVHFTSWRHGGDDVIRGSRAAARSNEAYRLDGLV